MQTYECIYDIFISYPKSSKWKLILSNLQSQLRNKLKFNLWIDYEKIEINKDLLPQFRAGIQQSRLFICLLNQDYLTSYNCQDELAYAQKLNKEKIIILLDAESEKHITKALTNYITVDAYKDLNAFQACTGEIYDELVDVILQLFTDEDDENETNAANLNDKSILDINNSLKIIINPNLNENDEDILLDFLSDNARSGGGEIINYEYKNNNYLLLLTYKNYEVKQRILNKKLLSFHNYHLLVYDGEDFINEHNNTVEGICVLLTN